MNYREIDSVCRELLSQREALLFGQLKVLVDKGLLVMKEGEAVVIQSPTNPNGYELRQSITIETKEAEYIARLEQENKTLKERLDYIAKALST